MIASEPDLVRLAISLGALDSGGELSFAERHLVELAVANHKEPDSCFVDEVRKQIQAGHDPLGTQFYGLRNPASRRAAGAVYTPPELVEPMIDWVTREQPARIVDAGSGSGRFIARAARLGTGAHLVAVDSDPLATLMTRGTLAVLGAQDVSVMQGDYTNVCLPTFDEKTAFVGNPPYVRHHELSKTMKLWAQGAASELGSSISGLAGLHAYFFLATAKMGRPGDVGMFVTSAEWLDVNYGSVIRELLLGVLGGESIHVVDPEALPFDGTATTAAITSFRIGTTPPSIRFRAVKSLAEVGDLGKTGQAVSRKRVQEAPRWTTFVRTRREIPEGYIELGELCRVHRGAVTGANRIWVTPSTESLPSSVLFASITRAKELFAAGAKLESAADLKFVIDLPTDLDVLDSAERRLIDRFIQQAKDAAVHEGYIASHRKAWWSVGLKKPAPILATYMARRPPAFVRNEAKVRHINIAHGLYPRIDLPPRVLDRLAQSLREGVVLSQGRTYAGGLTKFEPKEMERLHVPNLDSLYSYEPLDTKMVS